MIEPTPENLRAARLSAGHSQAEAAKLMRASSYRTVQDWESGRRSISAAAFELYLLKIGHIKLECLDGGI